jgi:hypothetical protein
MSTKSRESMYDQDIKMAAERAAEARKNADQLSCVAWNKRMLGYKGSAQPSPTLGDALNAGFAYFEVRCLGCEYPQHGFAGDHPARQSHACARVGTISPLQRLFAGPRACVQGAAISSRCGRTRVLRLIRRRSGGGASADCHRWTFADEDSI